MTAPAIAVPAWPAAIRCTRCGADAAPSTMLRPHEERYAAAHVLDGTHRAYVCRSGHRMLLRCGLRARPLARAEDATKPTEVALATSIARAGLVR